MNDQTDEIRSCVSLLREIAEICEHASLTGSLSGGSGRTAGRYNTTLERLVQLGAVPEGFFQPVPESTGYGEIGVEARMLAAYATKGRDGEKRKRGRSDEPSILMRLAPFVDAADLGVMVREHLKGGQAFDMEDLTHLAPFMDRETLGMLVRKNLSKSEEPETPTEAPTIPVPAPPEPKPSLDELLERLKQPNLTEDERDAILIQMRSSAN